MIVFSFFVLLAVATFVSRSNRNSALNRSREEWILDSLGLFMQGGVIPALQIGLSQKIYFHWIPSLKGVIHLSSVWAFVLNFVGVDYIYYWNHRLLHQKRAWPFHVVHHAAIRFDFLMCSRNTLWTPFLIIYVWVNAFFIYSLSDPFPFILGASVTAGLDLWRHTRFSPQSGVLHSLLSPALILPSDHAAHHRSHTQGVNFGANLNLWDRLHQTFLRDPDPHSIHKFGFPLPLNLRLQIFWPYQQHLPNSKYSQHLRTPQ